MSQTAEPSNTGWLYDRLVPHAGELAIVGHAGDCGGAVDSLLAGPDLRYAAPSRPFHRYAYSDGPT